MLRYRHDGIRVDVVVAVEVGDGAGLAEVFDADDVFLPPFTGEVAREAGRRGEPQGAASRAGHCGSLLRLRLIRRINRFADANRLRSPAPPFAHRPRRRGRRVFRFIGFQE